MLVTARWICPRECLCCRCYDRPLMPGSWRTAVALAAAMAALAACGGNSGKQGEAAKSPQQIAQDA